MSSIRLNNSIRDRIIHAALSHRFKKEAEAIRDDWAAFALKVYNRQYDQKTRDSMEALPEGWLPESGSIRASFGGRRGYFSFCGSFSVGREAKNLLTSETRIYKRFLARDYESMGKIYAADGKSYAADDKISDEFTDLCRKTEDLETRIKEAKAVLTSALNSVWTVGAVVKNWPHLRPFVPAVKGKSTLPAVTEKKLNELLDLPVA